MSNSNNLYDSLFLDDDETDIGMLAINEMYGHLNFDTMSNYISLEQYNKKFSTHNNTMLSALHINIRSLESNFTHLEAFLASLHHPPDILALTETWINDLNKGSFKLDGYCANHVVREPNKHGGVSLYIRSILAPEAIEEFSYLNSLIEICTVSFKLNNVEYTVSAIYRPGNKNEKIEEFSKELSPILKSPRVKKCNSLIMGDLNIDLLQHSEHRQTNEYLNLLQTFNYVPIITRATRFPQGQQMGVPSLLDHIFINFTPAAHSGIFHYDFSDHLPVYLNFYLPSPVDSTCTLRFRIFNQENEQKFTRKLALTLWEEILVEDDVDDNFGKFYSYFENMYNECFPVTTKRVPTKSLSKPWLSSGLKISIKTKNKMFKNLKLGLLTEQSYKSYKNRLTNLLKVAKKKYYTHLFTSFKTNTKKLWQAINQLTNSNSTKTNIPGLIVKEENLTDPSKISEAFNNYFVNASKELEGKLPPIDSDPLKYLNPRNPTSMPVPHATINDVINVFKSIKSKSCSIDDFSPGILKRNVHLLASPITLLFNQSVQQGKFPHKLKRAKVIPLYKKGAKTDVNNFRPISLLNIFSKIFEKIMKKFLIDFLDTQNIISDSQFGFQRKKCTEDVLIKFSKNIYEQLDKSNSVLSIFIDFSKAFDTVPHNILINKLHHYGIRDNILQWFSNYLSDRSQSTVFESKTSEPKSVTMGVPQGSVLGPILFLLFINDLPNVSKLFYTLLFADDATLSLCGHSPELLINVANDELYKFYLWCITNRLTVNTVKTFYMIFSNRAPPQMPPLVMKSGQNYDPIKRVESTKFLGIHYDCDMSFKTHIVYLAKRLSKISALIFRVRSLMPEFVLKNIYHAHVTSIINYCNIIWSNTFPTHLDPLVKSQKRIIRLISNSDFLAHTLPLFKELKLLNIDNYRKYSLAIYFFKILNSLLPNLQARHDYLTRYRDRPRPAAHHRTIYERSFIYQAPIVWNELMNAGSTFIHNSLKISTFKRHMKHFLLSR